jgi:phosphotransferase system enzyme I (PtsI)
MRWPARFTVFVGTVVAPGIAVGPAFVWVATVTSVRRRHVSPAGVARQRERLEQALWRAGLELDDLATRVAASVGESAAAVFRAHRMFLDDPQFLAAIRRGIDDECLTAESSVYATARAHARRIAGAANPYLAARADDIRDLGTRLLTHLRREDSRRGPLLERPCVLITDTLSAAEVVSLNRKYLLGLVMIQTGPTSHAALLASTLGVPVVCAVPGLSGHVQSGDPVVVDGSHGHVLVDPPELALREYRTRRALFARFAGRLAGLRDAPAVTPDGRTVRLTANIGLAEEIPHALAQGAEGIGLLRTEYFYLSQSSEPGEEEQYRFYAAIVDAVAPRLVTFRTFDLGADKGAGPAARPEENPMLGCRGIRLLAERRDLFVTQIRALLRASRHGAVRVMFPLITSLTEFQDTLRVVEEIKEQMRAEGIPFDDAVRFGCMIETPAAATIPDILATEVEFFSIGSNDLIQYTLAADRTNPRVAYIYEPLHLAVLRMMRTIIRAARRSHRPVSLCGEMAADPIYTIILLGLGVDELSMNPAMIPAIKQVIRGVPWAEARALAGGVLRERRARDVESYLERTMADRFPEMMSIYGHPIESVAPPAPARDAGARKP